jgi:alkaline phosphatase D
MKIPIAQLILLALPLLLRSQHNSGLTFDPELRPFYHGVASGDPLSDRVILWTRVTPEDDDPVVVQYRMARDTGMTEIVAQGQALAQPEHDYTVKVDVAGLTPATTYYYHFEAYGRNSLTGRTRTTPAADQDAEALKFAVVSCANVEGGYFNAYARIADRNDLDAVIHLGDYFYEYARGEYRNPGLTDTARKTEPPNELLTKNDYRTRYAWYRLDADLRRLHQQHPVIAVWDDHESANDSWRDGAQNHDPATEGAWEARRDSARSAYFEWMPIRIGDDQDQIYRRVPFGKMADLLMLDTRLEGRQQPPPHFDTPDFPPRQIMSDSQLDWLKANLSSSVARWKIIGNQIIFNTFNVGFAAGFLDGTPDPTNIDSIRQVEDPFIDNWESYPTQRNDIIDFLRKQQIKNTVFATGDAHTSWAFDVTAVPVRYPVQTFANLPQPNPFDPASGQGYGPLPGAGSHAVEFCAPSITAQNLGEIAGPFFTNIFEVFLLQPVPYAANAIYNPHLKYVDLDRHGYLLLDFRADSVQADYYYVPTVTSPDNLESWGRGLSAKNDSTYITNVQTAAPAPPKAVQEIPAPLQPKLITGLAQPEQISAVIFAVYPNPAHDYLHLQYGLVGEEWHQVAIFDARGKKVKTLFAGERSVGRLLELDGSLADLEPGFYFLTLETPRQRLVRKLIVF